MAIGVGGGSLKIIAAGVAFALFCALLVSPAAAHEEGELEAPSARPTIMLVVDELDDGMFRAVPGRGILGMLKGANRVELQLATVLARSADVVVIASEEVDAQHLDGVDAVVITASTSSKSFKPFMLKAAVPVVALKPANWNALGLAKRNQDKSTPLQRVKEIEVDTSHPIAKYLDEDDETVELFKSGSFSVGRGWTPDAVPTGDRVADVVANGPIGAALLAFETGDALGWAYLDSSDRAIACRVAFPSHGSSSATFSPEGVALFVGAVEWILRDECRPAIPIGTSVGSLMCRTQLADESRVAKDGEIVERTPADEPNLSALWVRAVQYAEIEDFPIVFVGGRFQTVGNASNGDDSTEGEEVERNGVFGCNLNDGTVTDFDPPILIDSLKAVGNAVVNERIRALAYDGEWIYIGGKFRLAPDAFPGRGLPEQYRDTPVSLIRVDPRTGAIDVTWRPNIRGSVSALAVHDDWLYVGGGVRQADNAPANRLIRVAIGADATGKADSDFRPNVEATIGLGDDDPFAVVLALEVVGDTLVAGGSFQQIDGEPRNSLAAFDLVTGELTDFAPSIGDNNLGTDPIPQIKDVAVVADGSVVACGDWWMISPEPGRTWLAYDHDGGADDPNGDDWFGQRSKIQPRPNQFNLGKFDLATGAAAMVDGQPWGPVTDGGIQACDVDPKSNLVILGGHYESVGTYVPGYTPKNQRDYPDTHVAFEKLTAIDGATGEIIAWDPDVDSIRGLDAVAIVPGVTPDDSEIIVGGAISTADRSDRAGLARFTID